MIAIPTPEAPPVASGNGAPAGERCEEALNPAGAAATTPQVVGVDLSLTATGVADNLGCTTIATSGRVNATLTDRARRIHTIRNQVLAHCKNAHLVVIEGPSLGSHTGHVWDRGGLWWAVVARLVANDIPVAVVSPKGRAKYIAGNGNAGKDQVMLAAVRRFHLTHEITNNNEADAVGLCAMGLDRLGHPLALVPDRNRGALDAVAWPELVSE